MNLFVNDSVNIPIMEIIVEEGLLYMIQLHGKIVGFRDCHRPVNQGVDN